MRFRLAILAIGTIAASEAAASSFVVLEADAPSVSPSIVTLGPSEPLHAVTPTSVDAIARLDADQPPLSQPEFEPDPIGALIAASETAAAGEATPVVRTISASVIVMGPVTVMAAAPVTDDETVAAIPRRPQIPTVIRGGVIGDVFSTAVAAPTIQLPEREASGPIATSAPRETQQPMPDPAPAMPEPPAAPPPPPPPSRPPPMLKGPE